MKLVQDICLGVGHLTEVVQGATMLLLIGGIDIAHIAERLQLAVLTLRVDVQVSHGLRELAPSLSYEHCL